MAEDQRSIKRRELPPCASAFIANPDEVKLATRSRKGYWPMSSNRVVQQAMTNRWLEEQGVPDLRASWIKLHYPEKPQGV